MDQSLRLRLVVRRNGLPEARILFNIPLANDPTIAQLVELVNESIPLESDDWGLDDYTVELHAKDGHAFECLHFQSVASIFEKDDEIFIRPLLTNDLKKRRISGRDQISSGGQHLIDGVPFGRPRLRAPRGRPAVHIAPRKRRRLTYDGDFDGDEHDDDDQSENSNRQLADEYFESTHDQEEDEEEEPLLLTQHGEPQTRKATRRVHFPRSVTATAEFDDTDDENESSENEEDAEAEDGQDEDMFEPDAEDLREELKGLEEEEAVNRDDSERSSSRNHRADKRLSVTGEVNDFGPFTEEDSEAEPSVRSGPPSVDSRNRSSHDISDKVIAVRSAFPAVPGDVCEKLLVKHNHDVGGVWKKLAQQLKPRLDLAQTMVLNTQLELPKEVMVISSPPRKPAEAPGEVSRIGDEDGDTTDQSSSADEDEEEDDDESEAHATSSESEDDESSDSEGDASVGDDPAPRHPSAANGADSPDSSSDESDSSDNDRSGTGEDAANLGETVKGGKRASSNQNESTSGPKFRPRAGLASRRRRNVIDSSPTSSPATNTKSNSGHGNNTVTAGVVSPSDVTDSSSSESDGDGESEADSDSSSSDDSDEDSQEDSSDSPSDSSSSSDSSSESESEAEVATPSRTNGTAASRSQRATTATSSSVKPGPTSAASQTPVAPGQGMTKTQRRNARRRIQMAAQRASRNVERPEVSTTQDADLMAKKQALLQSLGVSPGGSKGGDKPDADKSTDTSLGDAPNDLTDGREDPDAWREKISYRAVECVNEGAELTEPPFPFVQRWDSSQRRGKRKSRDDSQFYDGSNQNQKKRKCAQSSRQPADNYRDDTTMFSLNHDVVLNYDDEPVGLDQSKSEVNTTGADHTTAADEDDLPVLPADMSSLSQLSPDDVQPGIIVAWKQLLLTKANNWQPQLSNFMTAVVTEVDGSGDFQVQLAKRDRDVDKNEKEYDDDGGRVYAKFEVPDDDEEEDEEADLGFRDISFVEMIDPRIVLRPSTSTTETKTPRPPEQEVEVADSQPSHKGETSAKSTSNSGQSKTMDFEQNGQGDQINVTDVDSTDGPLTAGDSFVSETNHDVIADNETDVGAQLEALAQDVSISEERRYEISQLIHEGGFRQGVRSSIDQLTFLQFGSPSRQLEEEASLMLPSRQLQSSQRATSEEVSEASEEAPSEYGSKDPSQQEADSHAAHQSPSQPSANSDNAHGKSGAFGQHLSNGNVEYPKLDVSFTSQTSARSGRQIDPDFISHSDDLGHGLPDDSAMMDAFDDDDAPQIESTPLDEREQVGGGVQRSTPSQEVYNHDLPRTQDAIAPLTPFKSTQIGPESTNRPASAGSASTGSSSVFVDFELLGSQPAVTKFKEHIQVKDEEPSQASQGMTGLPDINETHSPVNARSKSPENGRSQSINGTPVSQRGRRLTRSVRNSPQNTNDEGSVSQRTRRSSRLMDSNSSPPVATTAENARKAKKHGTKGSPTPNGKPKSLISSFDGPVSPPSLSKLRQKPARPPSSSPGRKDQPATSPKLASRKTAEAGKSRDQKGASSRIPAGSQVMSLLTSSPRPPVDDFPAESEGGEDEIRFDSDPDDPFAEAPVERYADDDIDGDYHDSAASSTIKKLRARKSPSTRLTRGASVPVTEVDRLGDGVDTE